MGQDLRETWQRPQAWHGIASDALDCSEGGAGGTGPGGGRSQASGARRSAFLQGVWRHLPATRQATLPGALQLLQPPEHQLAMNWNRLDK
ncbi:rCG53443 [Rattus norvegicus]|uniref:RCG53443 n=1 Tax=Rattus norvegicus TaxID=10116 RepID=A6JRK3_RAT|nr:rCG53443 [Rattus norvegicus]